MNTNVINLFKYYIKLLAPYIVILLLWELYMPKFFANLSIFKLVPAIISYYFLPEFYDSLIVSFCRVFTGYIIASGLGISLGVIFGFVPWLNDSFDPILAIIRPISPLAWLPISIIWFGVSETATIFIIIYASFFPIFLNTILGISRGQKVFREAALCLGAKKNDLIVKISLPEAFPFILTGMRLSMGIAWSAIVAAELVIGFTLGSGIGYLLFNYANFSINIPRLIAITLSIGVIGLIIDTLLRFLFKKVTSWRIGLKLSS